MPLTKQESRCAELLCRHLHGQRGGRWHIATVFDDEYPSEPSPDVLLSNGTDEIAVEIKRLTDGSRISDFFTKLDWLQDHLARDVDGRFWLIPQLGVEFPLSRELVSRLLDVVPGVAASLAVGESGAVPVAQREAVLHRLRDDGSAVRCSHGLIAVDAEGVFYLDDDDLPQHRPVTDRSERTFHAELRRASAAARLHDRAEASWHEEWELRKVADGRDGEAGSVAIAKGVVGDGRDAAAESVRKAVADARNKFSARRWARRAAVALHVGEAGWVLDAEALGDAVSASMHPMSGFSMWCSWSPKTTSTTSGSTTRTRQPSSRRPPRLAQRPRLTWRLSPRPMSPRACDRVSAFAPRPSGP